MCSRSLNELVFEFALCVKDVMGNQESIVYFYMLVRRDHYKFVIC